MACSETALRLAVFDLDGTIVDSERAIVRGMAAAARHGAASPPAAARVRRVVGLPLEQAVAHLFPDHGPGQHDAMAQAYKDAIIAMRADGTIDEALYPGALEAIAALDADGWLLGIATGKPHRGLVNSLALHDGLIDRFVTLQTADRGPGKPSPDMLLRAMAETGAERTATVMIGDTTFDMEMARNAGTWAVGVAWGYHETVELRAAGAHMVVERYDMLCDALDELADGKRTMEDA